MDVAVTMVAVLGGGQQSTVIIGVDWMARLPQDIALGGLRHVKRAPLLPPLPAPSQYPR